MTRKTSTALQLVPAEFIERKIHVIRGYRVMLDSDLAALYQVPTKRLNEAVKRNLARFPDDFMFQLRKDELENWRSQSATSNSGAKMGLRRAPYAFTEHGVAMLSSVLTSKRAVKLNILIIRAFVRLREYLSTHKDLARKLEDVVRTQRQHGANIQQIYGAIERLLESPPPHRKCRIGFASPGERKE
jgi:ORF6N domain-containing protein